MDEIEYKLLFESVTETKEGIKEVRAQQKTHSEKTQLIEVTLTKVCESIDYHIKRTNLLEEMVEPIHKERIEFEAVKKYRKKQREELLYRLKLPVMIVTALGARGAILQHFIGN